jgi:hypothetical protein
MRASRDFASAIIYLIESGTSASVLPLPPALAQLTMSPFFRKCGALVVAELPSSDSDDFDPAGVEIAADR